MLIPRPYFLLLLLWLGCCLPSSEASLLPPPPPAKKKGQQQRLQQKRNAKKRLFHFKNARKHLRKKPEATQSKAMAIFTTIVAGLLYLTGLAACIAGIIFLNGFYIYMILVVFGLTNLVGFILNITSYLHDAASSITMALAWAMIQLIIIGLILNITSMWFAGVGIFVFGITFLIGIIEASN